MSASSVISQGERPSGLLKYAAIGGLLFLHFPILFIFLYAFTSESKSYQFPPPGSPSSGSR